jgi:hypothetical protein
MAIKADIDLLGADPDMIVSSNGAQVILSLEQVIHDPVADVAENASS